MTQQLPPTSNQIHSDDEIYKLLSQQVESLGVVGNGDTFEIDGVTYAISVSDYKYCFACRNSGSTEASSSGYSISESIVLTLPSISIAKQRENQPIGNETTVRSVVFLMNCQR